MLKILSLWRQPPMLYLTVGCLFKQIFFLLGWVYSAPDCGGDSPSKNPPRIVHPSLLDLVAPLIISL